MLVLRKCKQYNAVLAHKARISNPLKTKCQTRRKWSFSHTKQLLFAMTVFFKFIATLNKRHMTIT